MNYDVEKIKTCIAGIPFVSQVGNFNEGSSGIFGKVSIAFTGLEESLDFEVFILNPYPLKTHDSETIYFTNRELKMFNHVMSDGHICIHTSHSTSIEEKLTIDFSALKNWIIKYYINKEVDQKYEHIVLEPSLYGDMYFSFFFTDCDVVFRKGDSGIVALSKLNRGLHKGHISENYFAQSFKSHFGTAKECQWSNVYKQRKIEELGFYYFLEHSPAEYNKFGFKQWEQLENMISREYLEFLHTSEKNLVRKKLRGNFVPLFLGYNISEKEIHWQVAMLRVGEFPISGVPEIIDGKKTGRWLTQLTADTIKWAFSRNTSYRYFFGRGTFSAELTEKKILIIGLGAVGSMVATTLTRGGCRHIDFVDYDIKEPENVCRSEYKFSNGMSDKRDELENIVTEISPFLNTNPMYNEYFEAQIKGLYADPKVKAKFTEEICQYDIIFDCTTDNDLMYVLNELNIDKILINLSITNHARELVCAFHPNIYRFVNNQFANVLKNDTIDLYEPTGCWSPTFKASYNDISTLVQLALNRINAIASLQYKSNNFVIISFDGNFNINEF
jgi:hypothetical protein